jgi:hypothetical protein
VKTGSDVENVGRAESKGQEKSKGNVKSDNLAGAFCGDDRLTLMQVNLCLRIERILVLTNTDNFPSFLSRSRRLQRPRIILRGLLDRRLR